MQNRISRPQLFMGIAELASQRSTCMRLNVGAVIVKGRNLLSIGYNGSPPGHPHCSGNACPGRHGCSLTIHAEINALDHLPEGITGPLDLYCTDSPCAACYDRLIKDGRVTRIFFSRPFRDTSHLEDNLLSTFIQVYRVLPAGYVMEWDTGMLAEELQV